MTGNFEVLTDEQTRIFKSCSEEITRLRKLVLMGKRVVDDFLPNIGNCALQNYGELNEFMILAGQEEEKTTEIGHEGPTKTKD